MYAETARASVQRDPAPPPTPAGASTQPRLHRDLPGSRSRLRVRGTSGKAPTAARGGPGIASAPAGCRRGRACCAAGAASPSAPQLSGPSACGPPPRPTLRRQHPPTVSPCQSTRASLLYLQALPSLALRPPRQSFSRNKPRAHSRSRGPLSASRRRPRPARCTRAVNAPGRWT